MTTTIAVQETALQLVRFWSAQGALWISPWPFALARDTVHPETFFQLLAGQPWRSVCLQPVERPGDGRYGRHPFRLVRHLQLQVLIIAPPADARALYLDSLAAVGIHLAVHDLRFAEWSWQSSALAAWGVGWSAQLDGLGVTRLTYLQQLAGRDLEPVALELSYGIERLAMVAAGADSAFDLGSAPGGSSYADLRRRDEEEQSRYVAEVADPGTLRRRLEDLAEEAQRCLDAELARPAYEQAIRCRGCLDRLAARGVLQDDECAVWLERLARLIVAAATLYLSRSESERVASGESQATREQTSDAASDARSANAIGASAQSASPAAALAATATETQDAPAGRRVKKRKARSPRRRSPRDS